MNRERAMHLLAQGERAMEMYDGAKKAWQGMRTGKTASQLMREGALELIGGDSLSSAYKTAHPQGQSEKAVIAILGGIMGVIFLPPFFKKGH